MYFLTSHVLDSALRLITTRPQSLTIRRKQVLEMHFQPDQPRDRREKDSTNQPQSPHSVRLSN